MDNASEENYAICTSIRQYLQNVQNKLQGVLKNVVTREERKRIQTVVRMIEDWLIQSSVTMDGHTCEKLLAELRRLCVPVERRIHERHVALENLDNTIRVRSIMPIQYAFDYCEIETLWDGTLNRKSIRHRKIDANKPKSNGCIYHCVSTDIGLRRELCNCLVG